MLKHSLIQSHYGTSTSGGGISSPHPQHSSDGSTSHPHLQQFQSHPRLSQQQQMGLGDPTRYLEGHISPPHPAHSHSQSYLDHSSYPNVHSSRLYLDSSRGGGGSRGQGHGYSRQVSSHITTTTSPTSPKPNGNIFFTSPIPEVGPCGTNTSHHHPPGTGTTFRHGVLRSLSLLSVLSLLLALNSLIFLLKIVWPLNMSGGGEGEFKLMYEVTLCLAAMCLSINLCVLLVTSAQYFFAISGSPGTTSFLQRVTYIRGAATGGFFLSIPLFLAAIVLYTFTHLSFAIPALVTTAIVGLAIIFGGCAMVYHVFTWQKEKTHKRILVQDVSPNPTIELSTLV